jgi:hypothetical protein
VSKKSFRNEANHRFGYRAKALPGTAGSLALE